MLLDEVGIAEREDVEVPDSFMPQASAGFVSCPAVLDDWRVSFPFDQLRARSGRTGKLTPHASPAGRTGCRPPPPPSLSVRTRSRRVARAAAGPRHDRHPGPSFLNTITTSFPPPELPRLDERSAALQAAVDRGRGIPREVQARPLGARDRHPEALGVNRPVTSAGLRAPCRRRSRRVP